MNQAKIIRSICYFTDNPSNKTISNLDQIESVLKLQQFEIQTKRICSPQIKDVFELDKMFGNNYIFSLGTVPKNEVIKKFEKLFTNTNTHFNIDLTNEILDVSIVELLFQIILQFPQKTFNFTFVFNNKHSSPYFPSATYFKNGFSIGLQPTDLSIDCNTLDEWLNKIKETWYDIFQLFQNNSDFLGIDSSIAPLTTPQGGFIRFIQQLGMTFSESIITDTYTQISKFIKNENPKQVGLSGLMFPCLEDNELAVEYEKGNFSIERNLFLSLHSGLGIDTYPIGIDENKEKILRVLQLTQALSNKYKKPLSCRFVSDGKSKIGQKSNFNNQYLKDVIINRLK